MRAFERSAFSFCIKVSWLTIRILSKDRLKRGALEVLKDGALCVDRKAGKVFAFW